MRGLVSIRVHENAAAARCSTIDQVHVVQDECTFVELQQRHSKGAQSEHVVAEKDFDQHSREASLTSSKREFNCPSRVALSPSPRMVTVTHPRGTDGGEAGGAGDRGGIGGGRTGGGGEGAGTMMKSAWGGCGVAAAGTPKKVPVVSVVAISLSMLTAAACAVARSGVRMRAETVMEPAEMVKVISVLVTPLPAAAAKARV